MLRRFPIEPLCGGTPSEARIGAGGLVGDRIYELCDENTGETLTVSGSPLLLLYAARYTDNLVTDDLDAWTRVRNPAGKDFLVSDPEWVAEISRNLGRPVRLRSRAAAEEKAPLHLLSRATLRLVERTYGAPLEEGRLRANFVLEITGGKAFDEEQWIGRRIRIGDALLEITGPSADCILTTDLPQATGGDLDLLTGLVEVRGGHIGVAVRALGGNRVRVVDSVLLVD